LQSDPENQTGCGTASSTEGKSSFRYMLMSCWNVLKEVASKLQEWKCPEWEVKLRYN
jgi:hypothetical protein